MGRACLNILVAICLLLSAARLRAEPITLVENGKSDYSIFISPNPSATEQFAAEELAKYVKQMTGVDLPVHKASGQPPFIGITMAQEARVLFDPKTGKGQVTSLKQTPEDERFEIGRVALADPRNLYVIGRSPRAQLLGVYALLDALGCRFLTPKFANVDAEAIPKIETLAIDEAKFKRYEPALKFRKLYV